MGAKDSDSNFYGCHVKLPESDDADGVGIREIRTATIAHSPSGRSIRGSRAIVLAGYCIDLVIHHICTTTSRVKECSSE